MGTGQAVATMAILCQWHNSPEHISPKLSALCDTPRRIKTYTNTPVKSKRFPVSFLFSRKIQIPLFTFSRFLFLLCFTRRVCSTHFVCFRILLYNRTARHPRHNSRLYQSTRPSSSANLSRCLR